MKIYLIRHGETTGDLEDRYGGAYDDHLTERGHEQIQSTATKLVDTKIEVLLTSPLIRAKETAEIISKELDINVRVLDGLQERNYGVLGGLTKAEALEKYPEAVEFHKDPRNTDPQGESWQAFNERVIGTFTAIAERDKGVVALVSHGGPIKTILRHLDQPIPDQIGDGGVILLDTELGTSETIV